MKNTYKNFFAAFFIALSYGVSLLLPLFINYIGGDEELSGKVLLISGIGTITCVYLSKSLMKRYNPYLLAMLGGFLFALGALLFIFQHSLSYMLYFNAILMGCGWGICYNVAPYCLSGIVTDANRTKSFSYLSAFVVLGSGLSPTLVNFFGKQINFSLVFGLAVLTSLLSSLFFYLAKIPVSPVTKQNGHTHTSLFTILKTKTKYPLIMVFLGACAFTVMMNFQATYAVKYHLNYAIFYAIFAITVVIARFTLTEIISKQNPFKMAIFLVFLILVGVILFALVPQAIYLYPICAIFFSLGYGLTYPLIQAIAVNYSEKSTHAEVISFFSLSYFIGVYGFPFIAGMIITDSGYKAVTLVLSLIIFVDLLIAVLQFRQAKHLKH